MTHLLDTDTLSIWQIGSGPEYAMLMLRMSAHSPSNLSVPIISFHEQMIGANAYLNRGRIGADFVAGYARLESLRHWYTTLNVVPFDDAASTVFGHLKAAKIRIGTMDLRIAAIALSQKLVVVTRNTQDFSLIPGLTIEDWTH